MYLRELSCQMVLSDATDLMTLCINDTVARKLGAEDYGYDYFVDLDYAPDGRVTAVRANMARINAMSSELLSDIVHAADGGQLSLSIPIGNILGSSLLLGKGPEIPVDITMLSSSHVDFKNELTDAGINQTKHQIKLDVVIDIDVIMPWQHRLHAGRERNTHRRDRHTRRRARHILELESGVKTWTRLNAR